MEDEGGKRSTPQDRQGGVAAIAETGVWGGGMRRRKASDLPPPLRRPLSLLRGAPALAEWGEGGG